MIKTSHLWGGVPAVLLAMAALPAGAQSFRVQCPTHGTTLHPLEDPTKPQSPTNSITTAGAIKCQEIGGGDGFATMGDGHQIYLFGFAPLSGLGDGTANKPGILSGKEGTQTPDVFTSTTDSRRARIEPAD
ncbi:MAG: hypothetical protein QOD56_2847, partial [Gammaproteobacteria bacterium]|nr:hypothetical protein [Gammaproteobacteria bacterium]